MSIDSETPGLFEDESLKNINVLISKIDHN
jgi:hypothetical protein